MMEATAFCKIPKDIMTRKDITWTAKGVYAAINGRFGNNSHSWPSIRTIAKDAGVSVQTVITSINKLEELGLIGVERGGPAISGQRARSNRYSVLDARALQGLERSNSQNDSVLVSSTRALQKLEQNKNNKTHLIDSIRDKPKKGKSSNPSKGRKPDLIWNAVCELFGLEPTTKADRKRIGKWVSDFKTKNGVTHDEIKTRLERYRREWPKAADTPTALLKHWDRFATERTSADQPVSRIRAKPNKYAGVGTTIKTVSRR
jgi:DNA-binding transcriptional regulator YhcF (GntR family)